MPRLKLMCMPRMLDLLLEVRSGGKGQLYVWMIVRGTRPGAIAHAGFVCGLAVEVVGYEVCSADVMLYD